MRRGSKMLNTSDNDVASYLSLHRIRSTFDVRNFECEFVTNLPRELEERIAVAVEKRADSKERCNVCVFNVRLDVQRNVRMDPELSCRYLHCRLSSLCANALFVPSWERNRDSANESTLLACKCERFNKGHDRILNEVKLVLEI